MPDSTRIDSHKLLFHPIEVSRWLQGENIVPIYVEISPSGACNHRCTFCALDYLEYTPRFLDTNLLRDCVSDLGALGVKSIMYGGEGEPLLHRDIDEIIVHTKRRGIDVALTTNGVLLSGELASRVVPSTTWIKVSMNAGTAATYASLHRTREDDFERVFTNLSTTVAVIRGTGADCTLGLQSILLPENAAEMELLAKRAKEVGVSYLVIKAYSQHHKSKTREYENLDYSRYFELSDRLTALADDRFKVIFRIHSMQKKQQAIRGYDRCLSLPFWSYIDTAGNVWGCSAYLGDERFRYGSIYEQTFAEIWNGARRRESLAMVAEHLNPNDCRRNCRMDEVNRYLWELTHPSSHVNFI